MYSAIDVHRAGVTATITKRGTQGNKAVHVHNILGPVTPDDNMLKLCL